MATNQDVAHAWAHHRDKSSGNMSSHYRGDGQIGMLTYLNSYSTTVALKFADLAIMPWRERWSNTTARHLSHAHYAVSGRVLFLDIFDRYYGANMVGRLGQNDLRSLIISGLIEKISTSDNDWPHCKAEGRLNVINNVTECLDLLTEILEAGIPVPENMSNRLLADRLGTPTSAERKTITMALKKYGSYRGLYEETRAEAAEAQRLKEEAEARRIAGKLAEDAPKFREWQAGRGPCPSSYATCGRAFLRLKPLADTDNGKSFIETSLGVKFPLNDLKAALILYDRLDNGDGTWQEWRTNGEKVPMGEFKLEKITSTGGAIAGCHRVHADEIARIRGHLKQLCLI